MLDDALKTRIDAEIASESVVLFMKGTPVFPQCRGFIPSWCQISWD
jgi:glutaredoxin-related protein